MLSFLDVSQQSKTGHGSEYWDVRRSAAFPPSGVCTLPYKDGNA